MSDVCEGCAVEYPDGYVYPFRDQHLCGACALEATNTLHGSHYRKFHAPEAENLRKMAIAYRLNPKVSE